MTSFQLLIAFIVGLSSGVLFFGNLRWTVERMNVTENPVAFYSVSMFARMILVLVLAYLALTISIVVLLVGLAGFTIARVVVVGRSAFNHNFGDANGGHDG